MCINCKDTGALVVTTYHPKGSTVEDAKAVYTVVSCCDCDKGKEYKAKFIQTEDEFSSPL